MLPSERLFSNRSQMTSKCGKNKKVAHEGIPDSVHFGKHKKIHLTYSIVHTYETISFGCYA